MTPRLSQKAPDAFAANNGGGLEQRPRQQQQQCGNDSGEGVAVLNRRGDLLRTRAAPLGPHPYLDRFASGMHRPLGDGECSWRNACIQPVPIPDLTHTGIRTKFSSGIGDGFTPDGAMTEVFRTGIHQSIRNLPCNGVITTLGDTRDMRTRDYVRAVRRHRADPCGGSLIHAHMSSIELGGGTVVGPRSTPGGAGFPPVSPALRGSSSLRSLRSRFSPPSSPSLLASRGGRAGVAEGLDCGTLAEDRQELLQRELRIVKLAAAAVSCHKLGEEHRQTTTPIVVQDTPAARGGVSRGAAITRSRATRSRGTTRRSHGKGPTGANTDRAGDACPSSDEEARQRDDGLSSIVSDSTVVASQWKNCRQGKDWEGLEDGVGDATGRGGRREAGDDDDFEFQYPRIRSSGRRGSRGSSSSRRGFPPRMETALVASAPTTSTTTFSRRTTRHRQRSPAATKPARRKKPFSADSLFACLLDVRYGNTRDLSPDKRPSQKWNLTTLPAGITATINGSWDGLGPPEEHQEEAVGGPGYRGVQVAAPSEGAQRLFTNNDRDDDNRDDFVVVRAR